MESGCKEKIIGRMNSLTNTEKKIASYVLDNYEEMLNCNISELAERAGVSDASVVRFCRSLGYKGYQDFKVNAAKDVLPKDRYYNPSLEKDDTPEMICEKIFNSEISVLKKTLAALDMEEVKRAAELLGGAKRVFFFGSGASLIVGRDALHKLMKIGLQAYVYDDRDLQLMASSLIQEGDVAVGISHSGSNYSVLRCLRYAKENGAHTIALVNKGKSPISKTADVTVSTASEETIFQSESVSTRTAQLVCIDAIISIIAFGDYDRAYGAIQKTRAATAENKF